MSKQVQNFIDDARRFQRCSDHDLAISSLQLAQQEDHHKEHEIEIQKLFSLSYRKIGNYNMALLHINNAINQNAKRNNDKQAQNEHAICLMNKGIIYEESKRYDNALDCKLRLELIRMRSLPLRNLKDAESKIKEFIRSGYEPFNSFSRNSAVVNLKEIDSAKRTYNNVDYFLNFHDAMYSAEYFADFVRVMHLLICEKIGVDNFDTIAIPYDSNVILGVEVAKLFGKPVVKMRKDRGKLEIDHLWDGEFSNGNRVLIVHDVLVSGEQIIHTKNHIPSRCEIVALCCLATRKDVNGLEVLQRENVRVERVIDLSDAEIESPMNQ